MIEALVHRQQTGAEVLASALPSGGIKITMSRLCRSNLFFEEFFLELHLSEMYDEKGCIICIISETSPHFTGHIKG